MLKKFYKNIILFIFVLSVCLPVIANIDALSSLAEIAEKNNYVKPIVDESDTIEIKDGRHPVIEKMMADGEFIANDTLLVNCTKTIELITIMNKGMLFSLNALSIPK